MPTLTLSFVDPKIEVVHRPGSVWLLSGRVTSTAPAFVPDGSLDGRAEADLCRRIGDATVTRVDLVEDRPVRVRIWRGATSSYEAYFATCADGGMVVSDHFRNAVAAVAVEDRQPSDAVTVDHFLFRHARGRDTYARGVRRAGHGERVEIDVVSGSVSFEIFDRLEGRLDPRSTEEYVDDLDRALAREMDALRSVPGAVMMLSGGMDSTLMQSYVKHDMPALHVTADAADFHLGGQYLDAAADELGIRPERVVVRTEDFLDQLEDAVDGRALPPHFPQWVTLSRVFPRPHDVFVIGERAGAYARFGSRIPYLAERFSHPPGSVLQPLLRAAAVLSRPHRLRLLADQAPALGRDPRSPHGWGAQMPQSYGDRAWVERVFGRDAVVSRYEDRLAYVEQHVGLLPPSADRYFRHLEIARWSEFYNENNSQFRSLAFAYGKSVVDPFTSRAVIDAVLAVPATHRFEEHGHSKYIVERLLRERVPGYPKTASKDDIVVPFRRYLSDGPLARIWETYSPPSMYTGADLERLRRRPADTDWTAITWAVWKARIADNAALTPLPASAEVAWPIASQTSAHA